MRNLKAIGFSLLFLAPLAARASASLGDVAENLMAPTAIVTKLVLVACVIVGIALILVALAQYRIHRQSPKLVPLSTPITLLILGLLALLIPYGTNLFGPTFSAEEQHPQDGNGDSTLPLPDVGGNKGATLPLPGPGGANLPPPPPPPPPGSQAAPPPPPPPPGSSGDHWTQDPSNR